MLYAIIDIETTGLSPAKEKITEIAIVLHDGKNITGKFSSLINPEKKIPYRITQMTGISNQMVKNEPKFYEVAKQIVEMTMDRIVVGHNVRFDYGFLRSEFKSLGYDFQRKTIDTVKLSRKLIPGKKSYSLGKLCTELGISNRARHRAMGDAMATTQLFELLLSIEGHPEELDLKGMSASVNKSLTEGLPAVAGVYYFYDSSGELIYVGKSVNIRDRVLSHLSNNLHKKAVEMKNAIATVDYQITGSELAALLLESAEIKKHQPLFNRAQRRTYFNYGLYSFIDDNGYLNLKLMKIIDELNPLYTYSSMFEGREHLTRLTEKFELCQKLNGLYNTAGACFHYQIRQCKGACMGEEAPATYNKRVQEALENYHFDKQNFFVVDKGRSDDEKSVVKVEAGKYCGFGFIEGNISDTNDLHDCIKPFNDNREVRQIINSFIKKNKVTIIEF
jgi:DNA polymerase-3 subunit epsilon